MKIPSQMSVLEKIGFGAGDLSINVVVYSLFALLLFFQTDIFGITAQEAGLIALVVRVLDAVLDMTMGVITDRVTTRWGRYRPYLLWFAVPFGLSVALLYTTPSFSSYGAKLAWAWGTYAFAMVVFTGVVIPYISLPGVMTGVPADRLSANGYRLFLAKVGGFALTMVPTLAVLVSAGGKATAGDYQFVMLLMAAVTTVLLLFCFFTTKERVQHVIDPTPLLTQFRLLLRNDQWLILCAVCVIGTIGYAVRTGVAAYYAKYFLGGDEKFLSFFLSIMTVAPICAMVASTWLTKRVCKIQLFRWTQILAVVLSAAMYFVVKAGDRVTASVFFFVVFFVVDLHAPIFWSIISESIDYGAVKTGKRVSGLAYGGISFFQKVGGGLATAIAGWLLTRCNYVPNQAQSTAALDMIALTTTVIPAVFSLLMGLLMFRYRITDRYYAEMMSRDSTSRVVAKPATA